MGPASDVVILGGGVAGSTAALTLLQGGVKHVSIIEASDFSQDRIGETIPPDAATLLHKLKLTDRFASDGHLPCYGSRSLWGSDTVGYNDFLVSPYGHGWHLDRKRFDRMLFDAALEAGAKHIPERAVKAHISQDQVDTVQLSDGSAVSGGWFIDATGRAALLPKAFGIKRDVDDSQVVIWARFQVSAGAMGHSTCLEATPFGWWYGAELPDGIAIAALGTDPALAKSMELTSLPGWVVALSGTALIAPRLRKARLMPGSFKLLAAPSYHTTRIVGSNWMAVGDAASALDPLSSAGIYKALSSGVRVGEVLLRGEDGAAYAAEAQKDHIGYLGARAALYQAEQRWPEHLYWQQRCLEPA